MKILTLGCSYTSWKWPTWPDYLQQLLGPEHEVVNCGQKGDSNFIIAHKLNYLLKHYHWDKVFVMWTGSTRESLIIDDTNKQKVANLQNCPDLEVWEKIYANKLGDQLYVNINELKHEFKDFFPAYGTLDHHIKSDYDVLLGEIMLQSAGTEYYNMFYFDHDLRKKSLIDRLGHVTNFNSFNWLDAYTETFPYDCEKIGHIDNHPLPLRHFELAEKICDAIKIDKHNYTGTLQQAQDVTAKIKKVMDNLESRVTPETKLELQLKFNTLISRFPGCRDHKQFNFK